MSEKGFVKGKGKKGSTAFVIEREKGEEQRRCKSAVVVEEGERSVERYCWKEVERLSRDVEEKERNLLRRNLEREKPFVRTKKQPVESEEGPPRKDGTFELEGNLEALRNPRRVDLDRKPVAAVVEGFRKRS